MKYTLTIKFFTLVIISSMTFSSATMAGMVNKELSEELTASPVTGKTDPNHASLRCWQNGKLLFEELDWQSFSINNKDNVLSFEHKELNKQSLSLINLGETVCLYRKIGY